MASAATAAYGHHLVEGRTVAVIAGNRYMRSFQCEVGLNIVIEHPDIPRNRVVAGIATVLKIATVRIVFAVAANAVAFHFRVGLCVVAIGAFSFVVNAE